MVVGISGPSESIDITIFEESENKSDLLEINPKEIKRIPFTFVPSVSDIGYEIEVRFFNCNENNPHWWFIFNFNHFISAQVRVADYGF